MAAMLVASCQGTVAFQTASLMPQRTRTLTSSFLGTLPRGIRDSPSPAVISKALAMRKVVCFLEVAAPEAAKWGLRLVSFYALLRMGVAKEAQGGALHQTQRYVEKVLFGDPEKNKEREARKAATKWKESTKGTLVRKMRVPSVSQGRKLLREVAGVLSDDDLFVDVASHKGCQVRRETAHSETVCCANVRVCFDELPTPHVDVEITVFPAGPLTALEYQKAQKIEAVLRNKGNAI